MDQVRGKGDMIFDIDCGERGSEAGAGGGGRAATIASSSSLSIIIQGRDNGEERVMSGEERLGRGTVPS